MRGLTTGVEKRCIRSCVSSLASAALNAAVSASRSSTTSTSDRTTLSFAAATACRGNEAMRPARRSTNASISSPGRTRLTQPHRSAVAASMSSQPRTTSSARLRPISLGSRTVPPAPGMMPSATSGWLKIASGVTNRMSQASASSLPPPPTRPAMIAMVALGIVRSVSHIWSYGPISVGTGCSRGNPRIASTSKCARNHSGFADRNTTARTQSSCANRSISAASSKNTSMVTRLIGGWSIVTVAMPRSSTAVRRAVTPWPA